MRQIDPRTNIVSFRMSPKEEAILNAVARNANKGRSALIREMIAILNPENSRALRWSAMFNLMGGLTPQQQNRIMGTILRAAALPDDEEEE